MDFVLLGSSHFLYAADMSSLSVRSVLNPSQSYNKPERSGETLPLKLSFLSFGRPTKNVQLDEVHRSCQQST